MARTALIQHEDFALHDVGSGHPERPERITHLVNKIEGSSLSESLIKIKAKGIPRDIAELAHPLSHLNWVESLGVLPDPTLVAADTVAGPETPRIVRLAAGAIIQAIDAVMLNRADNAFCAVRPPGHHAEDDQAMGFCFYNNIAIGARYLQHHYGLSRIAIVDWDVHHGNGTQHSFETDPTVFFFSIHQFPHYPGTGSARECGQGLGEGFTLNIPVAAGSDDQVYIDHFHRTAIPQLLDFHPDFILISAGFDAHRDDPLGQVNMSEDGFHTLSEMVLDVAARCCSGRLVSILEGGYDLNALANSTLAHIKALQQA
jgi:acetoin utilization deacetylase AcuC-like enzyme